MLSVGGWEDGWATFQTWNLSNPAAVRGQIFAPLAVVITSVACFSLVVFVTDNYLTLLASP